MRALRLMGLTALAAGILLLAFAALEGDVRVGFFLVVPFVYGTGLAPFAGMVLLFGGLTMLMMSAFSRVQPEEETTEGGPAPVVTDRRSGGLVLLGPIPIVWGDAKVRPWMIGIGALILLLWLVVTLR